MIRLLLVDDQELIRLGFRMILETYGGFVVVGEAGDGAAAVELTREVDPDVVLMDIRMPGMDGVEATRRIVEISPRSRVLVLTTFDIDEYAFSALRVGASGFLLKDAKPDELVTAIRSVSSGDAVVAPSTTRRLIDAFTGRSPAAVQGSVPDAAPAPRSAALDRLTDREREVLIEVARGLSNAEIAGRLFVSETTVKTHVGRILGKLELRDRVQAVVFAYQNGVMDGQLREG